MGEIMKSLKSFFSLLLVIIFFSINLITAQEKDELGKIPMPVGGMETIMRNVVYPELARKAGIEGKIFVKAVINEKGDVVETSIFKGENEMLIKAAIDAVKISKFSAGEKDGKKVKAEIVVPIVFKLK